MWPFKKKPVVTFAEAIKDDPEPPCGQKHDHYRWKLVEGMPCPHCSGLKKREREREERKELAKFIVDEMERRQGPGSPKARFGYVMDELEKLVPDPEPYSARAPELRYLQAIAELVEYKKTH